jgi:hypothetical protein
MIENLLTLIVIVPTLCYTIAGGLFIYQGNAWAGIMWLGYAVANIAIMKQQGLL